MPLSRTAICACAVLVAASAQAQTAGALPPKPPRAISAAKPAEPLRVARVPQSAEPSFDQGTYQRISEAMLAYSAIEVRGGWPALPANLRLGPGDQRPEVVLLRRRLAISEDLPETAIGGETYDQVLADAVKRFQSRHGLPETGGVGAQTLAALNVPVKQRIRQLAASLDRLAEMNFRFGHRYVVVNIPAATAEVVTAGKVDRRYVVVVGKPDRPSPTLTTVITAVNLNPTWTVPLSIVKKDIVPKMRKDPGYVSRMHMKLLDAAGVEIDPRTIDWHADRSPNFTIRQDSGTWNALGAVRVDMPNPHSVYMHDTSHKNLFGSDYRFHSSGCTRVHDVRDFAAWLLKDQPGWSRAQIDAAIAGGHRQDIRLAHAVPVAWVYLTGWVTKEGGVHFRNDVYGHDEPPPVTIADLLQRPAKIAARSSGFVLQSADPEPAVRPVSYLDSR